MEDGPSPRLQHLRGMLIGRHNTSVETEHCHRFRPLISAEPALACSSITSRVQNGLVVVFVRHIRSRVKVCQAFHFMFMRTLSQS